MPRKKHRGVFEHDILASSINYANSKISRKILLKYKINACHYKVQIKLLKNSEKKKNGDSISFYSSTIE